MDKADDLIIVEFESLMLYTRSCERLGTEKQSSWFRISRDQQAVQLTQGKKMTDNKTNNERIVHITSMIGPLAGFVATIIATFSNLPTVIQYIMVLLLVMITVVSTYVVLGQWLTRLFKKTAKAIKHHFLTKKYFSDFSRFIDKLGKFLESRRCDNIPYILNKLKNNKPMLPDVSFPSVEYFCDLFVVLAEAVGKLRRDKENFLLLIRWFESILNAYDKICVCMPVDQIRIILKQGRLDISEDIKQEYRKNKTVYDKFILEYMDFANRANKDFGEKVARNYFEVPKEL